MTVPNSNDNKLCQNSTSTSDDCDEEFSNVPLVLIFFSQFVLGIGNTLYYSIGQTYIDDNSEQHKSPILLSYAYAIRIFGPTLGYGFAYVILRIYIDPTLTPVIEKVKDLLRILNIYILINTNKTHVGRSALAGSLVAWMDSNRHSNVCLCCFDWSVSQEDSSGKIIRGTRVRWREL